MKTISIPSHPRITLDSLLEVINSLWFQGGPVKAEVVTSKVNISRALVGRHLSFLAEIGLVLRTRPEVTGSFFYELSENGRTVATALYEGDREQAITNFSKLFRELDIYQLIRAFLERKSGIISLNALTAMIIKQSNRAWKPQSTQPRVKALVQILDELDLVTFNDKENIIQLSKTEQIRLDKSKDSEEPHTPSKLKANDIEELHIAEFRTGQIFLRIPRNRQAIEEVRGILNVLEKQLDKPWHL